MSLAPHPPQEDAKLAVEACCGGAVPGLSAGWILFVNGGASPDREAAVRCAGARMVDAFGVPCGAEVRAVAHGAALAEVGGGGGGG
jgi:hypothetical protein